MTVPLRSLEDALVLARPLALVTPHDWVMIALTGTWRGYRGRRTVRITVDDLATIVRNHENDVRVRIPADYEHQALRAVENGKPAPASGWFYELETRNEGTELWGRVEWTEPAYAAITAQEYAYLSAVIVWNNADRVSGDPQGAYLWNVALTNTPFLQELPAVAADNHPQETSSMNLLSRLCLALALTAAATTEEDVVGQVEALAAGRKALCDRLGLAHDATNNQIREKADALSQQAAIGRAVLSELQLAETTPADQALSSVQATLQHQGFVPEEDHQAALSQVEALQLDQLVARGQAERKIFPANESACRAMGAAALTAWLATAPATGPGPARTRAPAPGRAGDGVVLDDHDAAVMQKFNLTREEYAAAMPKETL